MLHRLGSLGESAQAARLLTLPFPPPCRCGSTFLLRLAPGLSSGAAAPVRAPRYRDVPPEAACVFSSLHSPRRDLRPAARALPLPRGCLTARLAVSPPLPVPVTAVLSCCYFRGERASAPARPAPSPQSTLRHFKTSASGAQLQTLCQSHLGLRIRAAASGVPGFSLAEAVRTRSPFCFRWDGLRNGHGAVLGHLFTSSWSPRGRGPTGALEAAPLAQQTAAYSGG
ncbi:hypothetical protein NDU88_004526 [Pleurodeles waltl]|uniref:Uncharacterized protein n=1 Tax=Pleurodeles waltl TaxID=8319 RepID=A0AAV7PCS6_PLEWA|nr:hypothetical protein NDU88_004526 [Pleurodeles waltl]